MGFAHGFLVLSDSAHVMYKVSSFYDPKHEKGFRWDDPDINIKWPKQTLLYLHVTETPYFLKISTCNREEKLMKILICGASGMLGSHFVRLLTERGIAFIAVNRQQLDITQLDQVEDIIRIQKITHVINCAAFTHVDRAETEQKLAYQVNAMGPHCLAIACRRHGAHLVHFSTDYVFDGREHSPYTEDHFCAPLGAYGLSKLAGEIKLLEEHRRSCIIRTSWLFGFPGKNFVETILTLSSERETLKIVSDQIGRPTYCQDLAEATLELLEEEGIYHFANAFETSRYHFAKEICRQAEELGLPVVTKNIEPVTTQEYPTPARRPAYSTLSTRKAEAVLGKTPRPWQEALKDYLVRYKAIKESLQYSLMNQ